MFRRSIPLSSVAAIAFLARSAAAQDPGTRQDHGVAAPDTATTQAAATTMAATEPTAIATNRPGFSDSAVTVGARVFQVEAGVSLERDVTDAERVTMFSAPLLNVRYGLTRRLEVAAAGEDLRWQAGNAAQEHVRVVGASDINIGAKIALCAAATAPLDAALYVGLSLPTGDAAFTSGGYDPTIHLSVARALQHGLSVSSTVGVVDASSDTDRFTQTSATLEVGGSLPRGWTGFGELYFVSPVAPHVTSGLALDAGVTRALGADKQIDVSVGHGLRGSTTDWFVGGGFSFRVRRRG